MKCPECGHPAKTLEFDGEDGRYTCTGDLENCPVLEFTVQFAFRKKVVKQ